MKKHVLFLSSLIVLLFMTGCSGSSHLPVTPSENSSGDDFPVLDNPAESQGRSLLGTWEVNFDTAGLTSSVLSERSALIHLNVKNLIPPPTLSINSFNPITNVIDVDVTLNNNSSLNVYDVRLIIFTDTSGHELLNPDNWTALYDIPGGKPINPFKTYATGVSRRKFAAHTQNTENLQIYLPQRNISVFFAVDASITGNCQEPFAISNFTMDELNSLPGASASSEVSVFDWQSDVDAVYLHCPEITGESLSSYSIYTSPVWKKTLINHAGAPAGQYQGIIMAESSNSGNLALYDIIEIPVNQAELALNPYYLSYFRNPGIYSFQDIDIENNIAYLSESYRGLHVVDISNPNHPELLTRFPGCDTRKLSFGDGYLFVDRDSNIMQVIDVQVPDDPVLLGKVTEGSIYGLAYEDFYVYAGAGNAQGSGEYCFTVYDVHNSVRPSRISSLPTVQPPVDICVTGSMAVVADRFEGILLIDVSDPCNPQLTGQLRTSDAEFVNVQGDYAYACQSADVLTVIDISDQYNPIQIAEIPIVQHGNITIDNNYAYIAADSSGLEVIDITNPGNPIHKNLIPPQNLSSQVKSSIVKNNFAYIAEWGGGLTVTDISDIMNPVKLSTLNRFTPYKVEARYNNAYVLENYLEGSCRTDNTLTILNTYDKEYLREMSRIQLQDPLDICLKDDYAYVADSEGGLKVIDIRNERAPFTCGSLALPDARSLFLKGSYAYICDSGDKLVVVNISNPANPTFIGYCNIPGAYDVLVNNSLAYVTAGSNGLKVVDVSNPSNLVVLPIGSSLESYELEKWDDLLIVSNYGNKLNIFNISNPSDLHWVKEKIIQEAEIIRKIMVASNFLFVSDAYLDGYVWQSGEVNIFKYDSQSNDFDLADNIVYQNNASDMDIIENYLYVVNGRDEGLKLYKLW